MPSKKKSTKSKKNKIKEKVEKKSDIGSEESEGYPIFCWLTKLLQKFGFSFYLILVLIVAVFVLIFVIMKDYRYSPRDKDAEHVTFGDRIKKEVKVEKVVPKVGHLSISGDVNLRFNSNSRSRFYYYSGDTNEILAKGLGNLSAANMSKFSIYPSDDFMELSGSDKEQNILYLKNFQVFYYQNEFIINNMASEKDNLVYSGLDIERKQDDLIVNLADAGPEAYLIIFNIETDKGIELYNNNQDYPFEKISKNSGLRFKFTKMNLLTDLSIKFSEYNIGGRYFKYDDLNSFNNPSTPIDLYWDTEFDLVVNSRDKGDDNNNSIKSAEIYRYIPMVADMGDFLTDDNIDEYTKWEEMTGTIADCTNNPRQRKGFGLKKKQSILFEKGDGSKLIGKINGLKIGDYVMNIRDANNYCYSIKLKVTDKYTIDVKNDPDNLLYTFRSNLNLNFSGIRDQIDDILGSGNYEFNKGEVFFSIKYFIPPKKEITGNLNITNIFGKTQSQALKFYIEKIPKKEIFASIYADRFNFMPKYGYWGNKIKIGFKNFTGFDLYFQECKLASPDFSKIGSTKVEEYFMDCSGEKIKQEYVVGDFNYWKLYEVDYEIPEDLRNVSYYRVSFYDDFRSSKFFARTNFGLYSKISRNNKLHLWAFTLNGGESIGTGNLAIYDRNYNLIGNYTMSNGYVSVDLKGNSDELMLLKVNQGYEESFMIVHGDGYGRYYYNDSENSIYKDVLLNSFLENESLGKSYYQNDFYRYQESSSEKDSFIKIYGYTDRALYKPGDDIWFSGFVRDLYKTNYENITGTVDVTLQHLGSELAKTSIEELDEYGGFKGRFQTSSSVKLGNYSVKFEFSNGDVYYQTLKIEEYQKPTFFIDTSNYIQSNKLIAELVPTYYFGVDLSDYSIDLDYSVVGDDMCRDCRWWNDQEYYYNKVYGGKYSTGGSFSQKNAGGGIKFELLDISEIQNRGYKLKFKGNVKVVDHKSDEVQVSTIYMDIDPIVEIGLKGQSRERLYNEENNLDVISGKIKSGKEKISKLEYIWYYRDFSYGYERGVDGNYYYINGHKYRPILSGQLDIDDNFQVPVKIDKKGRYFLRVVCYNEKGNIIGEVNKYIYYYNRGGYYYDYGYQGDARNNYKLEVSVLPKKYGLDDEVQVNINPYIKGATALVTLEKGNEILEKFIKKLDGSKLTFKAKRDYYPNINVSVVLFVGEDLNDSEKRKEPRFYVGYAEAELDDSIIELNIDIKPEKMLYRPGEEMNFDIFTTDSEGNPVDARVSVAIVDKALADLYDLIKEPIPHFYYKMGSYLINFSNMRMLYQALRVFSEGGYKGGGGGDSGQSDLRDKFEDLAYWRGGELTKEGKVHLSTILPDNLTTWMIDVIGVTKDTKLGTQRAYFKVSKPLMVQINPPLYLTLGDKIKMPVKIVLGEQFKDKQNSNEKVKLKGKLIFQDETEVSLGEKEISLNEKAYFELSIPNDRFSDTNVKVQISAEGLGESDSLSQEIPIRSQGFVLSQFMFTGAKSGSQSFSFENSLQNLEATIAVSKFPVSAFEKAFKYLLHYPYGCTEQLSSGLYPILVADKLTQDGFLSDSYIKDGKIKLAHRGYVDIGSVVEETLGKIYKNQKADGGFGYWSDSGESSNQTLSVYVYGMFKVIEQQGYALDNNAMNRLNSYIEKIGATNPELYLYYIWNKSMTDTDSVNYTLIDEMLANNNENSTIKVLAFGIYSNAGKYDKANDIRNQIDFSKVNPKTDWYWTFLNIDILKAIYLRGLVANNSNDNIRSEAQQILLDFLKSRNSKGRWGRSTQNNVNILLALGDYLLAQEKTAEDLKCEFDIGGSVVEMQMGKDIYSDSRLLKWSGIKEPFEVKWNCNQNSYIDVSLDYLLSDLDQIKNQAENITGLSLSFTGGQNIADEVTVLGKFQILEAAEQVAVEFFVPADIKLLDIIGKKTDKMPFVYKGGWNCRPNHYEVRFDRLFLYFDKLNKNQKCSYSIRGIKAFDGEFNIMPTRLFEMYKTNVWGRTVVK